MASGRLSREAKGKGLAEDPLQAPRTARIRAQAPDNEVRLRKLSLTIIGRVTNQSVQKVWSLIPFFTELWKAESRPVGSDLGNGMFQFQFEYEADLLTVLDKRPYHFARWMVIVQRWEPTVSESFPSLIPFWIKIQGVPLHLWSEDTVKSLGKDIGIFEKAEVTSLSMKMRVQINGRLPLIKTSVIEYPNGDEVTAYFVYEKLERHCSKCFRLDHDINDCLVAKHEERARKAEEVSNQQTRLRQEDRKKIPLDSESFRLSATNSRAAAHYKSQRHRSNELRFDARETLEAQRRARSLHEAHRSRYSRDYAREYSKDWQKSHQGEATYNADASYNRREARSRSPSRRYENREHPNSPPGSRGRGRERRADSKSSESHRSSSVRGNPLRGEQRQQPTDPQVIFNEALEEVRDVMVQYTQCADPTESAARRERFRKAEEGGQLEEAAARMIQAAVGEETENIQEEEVAPSAERIPVNLRLGPMAPPTAPPKIPIEHTTMEANAKRKPGRPPGKRKVQSSPKLITGSNSRKRKTLKTKPAQQKRKTIGENSRGRCSRATGPARGPARESSKQSTSATNSEDQPICKMIPISARRRVDFQNPSSLGP